jgi:hypothetical protein
MAKNQNLYEASKEALMQNGVPEHIAEAASEVVANDDATKSDLGRTAEDQAVIKEAMHHFWQHRGDAK